MNSKEDVISIRIDWNDFHSESHLLWDELRDAVLGADTIVGRRAAFCFSEIQRLMRENEEEES